MKIYLPHATACDYQTDIYAPVRGSSVNAMHTIILPHEGDNEIKDSRTWIRDADLIVAEVSYPSTGMGIELGWAWSLRKPIIVLHRDDRTPSSALKQVTKLVYAYAPGAIADTLERAVAEYISSSLNS